MAFGLGTGFRFTGLVGNDGIELSASINPAEIATENEKPLTQDKAQLTKTRISAIIFTLFFYFVTGRLDILIRPI